MITPVYDSGDVRLYCLDFRRAEEALPEDWQCDLCLADPPYGETSLPWDRWVVDWPATAWAWAKPAGSLWCFGSLRTFLQHRDDFALWQFAQDVVWEKHNGSSFHADRFKRVHEYVAHFYPQHSRWAEVYKAPVTTPDATKRTARRTQRPNHTGHIEAGAYTREAGGPRLMRSVLYVRSCHGYAVHPTQKPLGILTPLIEYSCPPGGTVLVPFAGSGSELLAARLLGRQAVGFEVNPDYCAAAAARLAQSVLPLEGAG